MTGRRVYPNEAGELILGPGDYGKDRDGSWYGMPPGFERIAALRNHEVVEWPDETITAKPSIRVRWSGLKDGLEVTEEWHGFLEHGVWREC